MRLIVAGSRGFNNYELLARSILRFQEETGTLITEIVCGVARGADSLG